MKSKNEQEAADLAEELRKRVPGVDVKLHAPSGQGNVWWIDAALRDHSVVIEWAKEDGFGVSTPTEDDYGSAANEVYADANEAIARVVHLLESGERARARREMHLQTLRS